MNRAEMLKDLQDAVDSGDTELEDAIYAKLEALDKLPVGNRFLLGVGNAAVEDAMGLGQLAGLVDRADVDAQKAKFKHLSDDTAFNVGGVTGKIADVLIPGGALKNFGGYIPKIGSALSKVGEMVATPQGIRQALTGGAILGATQPVGTDDRRWENTLKSAAASGLPMASMKGFGVTSNFARASMPTNKALQQIKDVFDDVPETAPSIARLSNDPMFVGPATPKYFGIEDINPTTSMLTENPGFRILEQNARVRNPGIFEARDNANSKAVYDSLFNRAMPDHEAAALQDALNANTGALRESAFTEINRDPNFINPIMDWIVDTSVKPGVRESSAMSVLNKANKQTRMPDVQAEDVYKLRTEFDDMLRSKTATDEMTNSAKNNRRLIMELKNVMDDSMSNSSGGKWDDYLSGYSSGMKPIEEGRAFQNVIDKFENARTIDGTPVVTPHALRRSVNSETYKLMGKQGYVDLLSQEGRSTADAAVDVMNDIERAKSGVRAINGSQTTPLATALLSEAMPKSGLLGTAIDFAKNAGIKTKNSLLDNAAYDPVLMQELLNKYHKTGVVKPYKIPGYLPYLSSSAAASVPYITQ